MALTEFGKAVRKARIDVDESLASMAEVLKVSCAFLSAVETGRKKAPLDLVSEIEIFFIDRGLQIPNLMDVAVVSNKLIPLGSGISIEQKMLVARFARTPCSDDQLEVIAEFFKSIESKQQGSQ